MNKIRNRNFLVWSGICFVFFFRFLEANVPNSRYERVFIRLGQRLEKKGKYDQALDLYQRALKHKPNSALAYYAKGAAFFALQDLTLSIDAFRKASFIDPANDRFLNWLGQAYLESGDSSNAIFSFKKAVQLNKSHNPYWYDLGCAHLLSGNYEAAYHSVRDLRAALNFELASDLLSRIHTQGVLLEKK